MTRFTGDSGAQNGGLAGAPPASPPDSVRESPGFRDRGALGVAERTVGHHLAHVHDKTGRRTRAGAAVFAMEHGLLPG